MFSRAWLRRVSILSLKEKRDVFVRMDHWKRNGTGKEGSKMWTREISLPPIWQRAIQCGFGLTSVQINPFHSRSQKYPSRLVVLYSFNRFVEQKAMTNSLTWSSSSFSSITGVTVGMATWAPLVWCQVGEAEATDTGNMILTKNSQ